MNQGQMQVCPVCNVKILKLIGGDRVIFSTGAFGTREMLRSRVCRHVQKAGCINKDEAQPPKL
ncbi:hypothetical protein [Myxacorys almedinensis]|uniref:Uncharacterized protein n=1 Tax=Myxacorys almedinensis A TaxID=2690445 RepID=A0A8J8CL54_9CYAN|nr:hypothetical protein [Myxacorys almedinensis]NDJ15737.1 hypothetical protein [Myxacorys almedinensis A]